MTLSIEQYGTSFQVKVISSLLNDKEFLSNIHDILNEEYFPSESHKWIIKEILKYYEKYHCPISMDVLKIELHKIQNDVLKISIKEQLKAAYEVSNEDMKYVQEEFSTFCKNQMLKKALLNSVDLLNIGEYDAIYDLIGSALKAGQNKNIGHEYSKDIEFRYREESRITIPTPWDKINELIQGGIGSGDFGLVFGNPGGGKSWTLVAMGGFAVKLGYNVVHYTLELGEDYVGKRYDAFFTEIPVDKLKDNRDKIEEAVNYLPGNLIIKEFDTGRATIHNIESHINKISDMGFKPDLVIIDYVDLLATKKKTNDRKGEIDDIYISTKGLARKLKTPIWSVSQVNRTGAKEDIIEGTSAAGSYEKIMISDLCISLSRKKEDKINGTGRFHIMKNRYGMDGLTFNLKADTSTGHFEVYDYDEESQPTSKNSYNNLDDFDKQTLKSKFFELNS
jgi:replicative DNA helicase